MATRPKRTLRQPDRFAEEYCVSSSKQHKKMKKDNNLYEIEVKEVDQERKLVRIHYKGYSPKFDEWRPYDSSGKEYFPFVRQEKPHVLTTTSLPDRAEYFKDKLYRAIKRTLYSTRKDDPAVRVEIDACEDVFSMVLGNVVDSVMERGRLVYNVPDNRSLDSVLGQKWDERIINYCGDFAFVVEGTVKFWMGKRSPIIEYKLIGKEKYVKTEVEDCSYVVFTFVRGDGNSLQYQQRQ